MFCYQCEQTAGGAGCTRVGVCGQNKAMFTNLKNVDFDLKLCSDRVHPHLSAQVF